MGGRQADADELLWKVPGVENAGAVLIPQEPFAAAYSQEMGIKDGAPSTGFVGEHTRALLRHPYMKHTIRKVQVEMQRPTTSMVSYLLCQNYARRLPR